VRSSDSKTKATLKAYRKQLFQAELSVDEAEEWVKQAREELKQKDARYDQVSARCYRLSNRIKEVGTHVCELTAGPDAFVSERTGRLMELCVRAGGTFSKSPRFHLRCTRFPLSVHVFIITITGGLQE